MPRPTLNPTDEQRRLVKSLAACGIRQEDIARKIGIRSPKTLRKYFRKELTNGATDANYKVAKSLFDKAVGGDTYAAQFWLRCRAGWKDQTNFATPAAPPPFIVAKEPPEAKV
jgi:hypothetical protein